MLRSCSRFGSVALPYNSFLHSPPIPFHLVSLRARSHSSVADSSRRFPCTSPTLNSLYSHPHAHPLRNKHMITRYPSAINSANGGAPLFRVDISSMAMNPSSSGSGVLPSHMSPRHRLTSTETLHFTDQSVPSSYSSHSQSPDPSACSGFGRQLPYLQELHARLAKRI